MTKRPNDDRDSVHPQFRSKPASGTLDGHEEPHPFFKPAESEPFVSLAERIDAEYQRRRQHSDAEVDPVRDSGWAQSVDATRTQAGQKGR